MVLSVWTNANNTTELRPQSSLTRQILMSWSPGPSTPPQTLWPSFTTRMASVQHSGLLLRKGDDYLADVYDITYNIWCSDHETEGVFRNYYTGEAVDLTFAAAGEVNGGEVENCAIVVADWNGWSDWICNIPKAGQASRPPMSRSEDFWDIWRSFDCHSVTWPWPVHNQTWNSPGIHLTFTWHSPDIHLITWPSSDLPLTLTLPLTLPDLTWPSPDHLTIILPSSDPYIT